MGFNSGFKGLNSLDQNFREIISQIWHLGLTMAVNYPLV